MIRYWLGLVFSIVSGSVWADTLLEFQQQQQHNEQRLFEKNQQQVESDSVLSTSEQVTNLQQSQTKTSKQQIRLTNETPCFQINKIKLLCEC